MYKGYKNLGCAVALQAARDYLRTKSTRTKKRIIKDLKSEWMRFITDDMSVMLAEKLLSAPKEVWRSFTKMGEEIE